jgi:hypothetical protein
MKYWVSIGILIAASLNAQNDSSRTGLSAIQAGICSALDVAGTETSQQRLQAFVKVDPYLYTTLQGYDKENSYVIRGSFFEQVAGGKIFFKFKNSGKFFKEFFIGLRFTQHVVSAVSYSRNEVDTIGSFKDQQTGLTRYVLRQHSTAYNFLIRGNTLFAPMGINLTTNPHKFFWFTAGIELAPSLLFGHRFVSDLNYTTEESSVNAGEPPNFFGSYFRSFSGYSNSQKISGPGIGIYLGIPVSVYMRPFRKETNGLRHFNLFATLMPLATGSKSRFSDYASGFTASAGAGLRYDLRN